MRVVTGLKVIKENPNEKNTTDNILFLTLDSFRSLRHIFSSLFSSGCPSFYLFIIFFIFPPHPQMYNFFFLLLILFSLLISPLFFVHAHAFCFFFIHFNPQPHQRFVSLFNLYSLFSRIFSFQIFFYYTAFQLLPLVLLAVVYTFLDSFFHSVSYTQKNSKIIMIKRLFFFF